MTSDVTVRVKVSDQQTQQQVVPADSINKQGSGGGFPVLPLVGALILLAILIALCFLWYKRRRQTKQAAATNTQRARMINRKFVVVAIGLLGAVAAVGHSTIPVRAEPTAELTAGSKTIDLEIGQDRGDSQQVDNQLTVTSQHPDGYAVEAVLTEAPEAAEQAKLPKSGLQFTITGGDVKDPALLSTDKPTRLKAYPKPGKETLPISLRAAASPELAAGEYMVLVRFTVVPTASNKPKPQQSADANNSASSVQVRELADLNALLAADLAVGELVRINNFSQRNDAVRVTYRVANSLPADGVLQRVSVPLKAGKYAVPQLAGLQLPGANGGQRINELLEVAQTYADAGKQLVWDPSRSTPLSTSAVVHSVQRQPFALTCSSFVGMTLSAWKFQNTTYVANSNTRSYGWGTSFRRPAGTQPPFQAWKLLAWLHWQGRAAPHQPGVEDYRPGDILFFSKQDPEGPGTSGRYFMNVYHVGIYMGGNRIIHSYSNRSTHGVEVQSMSSGLKNNLSFIARPNLQGGS